MEHPGMWFYSEYLLPAYQAAVDVVEVDLTGLKSLSGIFIHHSLRKIIERCGLPAFKKIRVIEDGHMHANSAILQMETALGRCWYSQCRRCGYVWFREDSVRHECGTTFLRTVKRGQKFINDLSWRQIVYPGTPGGWFSCTSCGEHTLTPHNREGQQHVTCLRAMRGTWQRKEVKIGNQETP